MIAVVDIETYQRNEQGLLEPVLDSNKFTLGVLWILGNKKPEVYYDKNKLKERIIELGNKCRKHKKIFNVYAHNHAYDFYGYMDVDNPNLIFWKVTPFLLASLTSGKLTKENKPEELVKFMDTYAIYRGSLKDIGEMLDMPKMVMPKVVTFEKELEEYCTNDVKVTMEFIKQIKDKLKEQNVKIQRLSTIGHIGISYVMSKLISDNKNDVLFENKFKQSFWKGEFNDLLHQAYRGGRCQAFQLGEFKDVYFYDINSLYPKNIMEIDIPDMRTEVYTKNPLKDSTIKETISGLGVANCLIYNESDKYGLLPIRTKTGSYYPKIEQYFIGAYTKTELRYALENGYKILDIEWDINYEKLGFNPFKSIYEELYVLRKTSKTKFDDWFFKSIMNNSIGKLIQNKNGQEFVIDSVEDALEYLRNNYEMVKSIKEDSYNVIYKRDRVFGMKPYYFPVAPIEVNALGRIKLHGVYKNMELNEILYSDTDSVFSTINLDHILEISDDKMGAWKKKKGNLSIFGRKSYMFNNYAKISGFHRQDLENIKNMKAVTREQISIKTKTDLPIGSFVTKERDLQKQMDNLREIEKEYSEQTLLVDEKCPSVFYFKDKLKEILK